MSELLPQVREEMDRIDARLAHYEASYDQAMVDLTAICRRASELSRQLRVMKRRLRRDVKRVCDTLDAIAERK